MEEVWKDIPGYEGIYQVSDLGHVRSLDRISRQGRFLRGQLLKEHIGRSGYPYVTLKNGRAHEKTMKVHRLVATAFVDNPNDFPQVNHKDENKSNNRAENLEWCTSKYNINYGTAIERAAAKQQIPVVQLTPNDTITAIYSGMSVAARLTGVSESKICSCCAGKRNTAGGFKWVSLCQTDLSTICADLLELSAQKSEVEP